MRIVSLVPHATELLFALGLGPDVVGVTHECDYPPQAPKRPRVTRDVLPAGLSAPEIDAAVRERTLEGQAIYELDRRGLVLKFFSEEAFRDCARITLGTPDETSTLVAAFHEVLASALAYP